MVAMLTLLQPFSHTGYNGGVPYGNMVEFLDDMYIDPILAPHPPNTQRKILYKMLNEA